MGIGAGAQDGDVLLTSGKLSKQSTKVLFRFCGLPRWTHIIRCHPPTVTYAACELVDRLALNCLKDLLGLDTATVGRLFDNPLFANDFLSAVPFTELAPMAYEACAGRVFEVPRTQSQKERASMHMTHIREAAITATVAPRVRVHAALLADITGRTWMECRANRAEYFIRLRSGLTGEVPHPADQRGRPRLCVRTPLHCRSIRDPCPGLQARTGIQLGVETRSRERDLQICSPTIRFPA
jgi:hypothetical protein